MARLMLLVFLSLFQLTLSAPSGYTRTTGRLIDNSFGVPGQNLTYDYIVFALSLSRPFHSLTDSVLDCGRGYRWTYYC